MEAASTQPLKIMEILDRTSKLYPKFYNQKFFTIIALFACAGSIPIIKLFTGIFFYPLMIKTTYQIWKNPEQEVNLDNINYTDKILEVFLLSLLIGICSSLWAILLIVPGIIYALNRSQAIYRLVLENKGISESITESKNLMSFPESKLRLFGMYALMFVVFIIIAATTTSVVAIIFGGSIITTFIIQYIYFLYSTFAILATTGFYIDIINRNKGMRINDTATAA